MFCNRDEMPSFRKVKMKAFTYDYLFLFSIYLFLQLYFLKIFMNLYHTFKNLMLITDVE